MTRSIPVAALLVGALAAGGLGAATWGASQPAAQPGVRESTLACPAEYRGTEEYPVVPTATTPDGVDLGDALAPAAVPSRVVICQYSARENYDPVPPPRSLTKSLELTEGLEQVAADLHATSRQRRITGCTEMGGPITRQLIGLEYPTGAVWISATEEPNGCVLSTNGAFSAGGGPGHQAAKAVRDGGWVVPTQGERQVCEGRQAVGREGMDAALVPGSPTAVWACRVDSDKPGTSSGEFNVLERPDLLSLLDDAPLSGAPDDVVCGDERTDRWHVIVSYGEGAPVVLDVSSGDCGDGAGVVSNGTVSTPATEEVLDLLMRATTN